MKTILFTIIVIFVFICMVQIFAIYKILSPPKQLPIQGKLSWVCVCGNTIEVEIPMYDKMDFTCRKCRTKHHITWEMSKGE